MTRFRVCLAIIMVSTTGCLSASDVTFHTFSGSTGSSTSGTNQGPLTGPSGGTTSVNAGLGLNVDFNEQSFVDFINPTSALSAMSGSLTGDAQGWPEQDFQFSYDNRYTWAWVSGAPNADPTQFSTDLSGTYMLTFNGQASINGWGGATISGQTYNSATNITTAQVTLPQVSGGILFGLQFTNTKRNPGDSAGDGVTQLHLLRPGYPLGTTQIFTNEWLHATRDFGWSALRFMSAMGTNSYGQSGTSEAYPYLLQWNTDRTLPSNGPLYAATHLGTHGPAWEYVVQAANAVGKDIWINVPVNASDDYVTQMAALFHSGLNANINVYLEYSNEMWHLGFPQGPWNQSAAAAEVAAGNSNLNYDNIGQASDMWRFRRIAERTSQIGAIFKSAFSDNPSRIRPVINNAWPGFYADMLNYVANNIGPPAQNIFAIAQTGYYSSSDWSSVQAILQGEMANSDANSAGYLQTRAIASFYGLHEFVYEGGEGETGNPQAASPADPNIANKFAAARDPGMHQVLTHDLLTNWFPDGGEIYMEFSMVGRYSVYGFWGLSEDLTNLSTSKWLGAQQVLSTAAPAVSSSRVNFLPATVGGSEALPELQPSGTNWTNPWDQPWLEIPVNAVSAGTYSITLQGKQSGSTPLQVWVDNREIGSVSLPTGADGISAAVSVQLTAGLHAIFVYGPPGSSGGPGVITAISSDRLTITKTN
jgi:hypothetical protein